MQGYKKNVQKLTNQIPQQRRQFDQCHAQSK